MKLITVEDFIKFYSNEARQDIQGRKINIEKLDKFFALAEVVRDLFKDEKDIEVMVEQPEKDVSVTNILVMGKNSDFEKDRKDILTKIINAADGVSISGYKKQDNTKHGFIFILSVEDIWEE